MSNLKKLAELNDMTNDLYIQEVRAEVRKQYDPQDEIAMLRKAVAILFDVIALLHSEDLNNEEFKAYNDTVEAIKARCKEVKK